jgi:hypothetical protein
MQQCTLDYILSVFFVEKLYGLFIGIKMKGLKSTQKDLKWRETSQYFVIIQMLEFHCEISLQTGLSLYFSFVLDMLKLPPHNKSFSFFTSLTTIFFLLFH